MMPRLEWKMLFIMTVCVGLSSIVNARFDTSMCHEVETREVQIGTIEFTSTDGYYTQSWDFQFSESVPMNGVSGVVFDAFNRTMEQSSQLDPWWDPECFEDCWWEGDEYICWEWCDERYFLAEHWGQIHLLNESGAIVGPAIPLSPTWSPQPNNDPFGGRRRAFLVHDYSVYGDGDGDNVITGFRMTLHNNLNTYGYVNSLMKIRYSAMHGNQIRVHFPRGEWGAENGHRSVVVSGLQPVTLNDADQSQWQVATFDTALPGDGLKLVFHSRVPIVGDLVVMSSKVQSELILDNGAFIALDDLTSPALNQPPGISGIHSNDNSLYVTGDLSGQLAGREVIGWRWRAWTSGIGEIFFSPPAVLPIHFAYEQKCPALFGDLNGDGTVDLADLLILLSYWGPCEDPSDCPADLTGDGVVDLSDLLLILSNWG